MATAASPAQRVQARKPSFNVDAHIRVELRSDLAFELAELILESDTPNPALRALAHELKREEGRDE